MSLLPTSPSPPMPAPTSLMPKYQSLAAHYRSAIQAGSLLPGQRMPSLQALMRQHAVSLSTTAAAVPPA